MSDDDALTIAYMEGAQDLKEVKCKLEIAVKGLENIKTHIESIVGDMGYNSGAYKIADKCLKDLGVK